VAVMVVTAVVEVVVVEVVVVAALAAVAALEAVGKHVAAPLSQVEPDPGVAAAAGRKPVNSVVVPALLTWPAFDEEKGQLTSETLVARPVLVYRSRAKNLQLHAPPLLQGPSAFLLVQSHLHSR
jgi:hypothetical protein